MVFQFIDLGFLEIPVFYQILLLYHSNNSTMILLDRQQWGCLSGRG